MRGDKKEDVDFIDWTGSDLSDVAKVNRCSVAAFAKPRVSLSVSGLAYLPEWVGSVQLNCNISRPTQIFPWLFVAMANSMLKSGSYQMVSKWEDFSYTFTIVSGELLSKYVISALPNQLHAKDYHDPY